MNSHTQGEELGAVVLVRSALQKNTHTQRPAFVMASHTRAMRKGEQGKDLEGDVANTRHNGPV